ncbi:MAG TPA: gliding motility-associated C-terminal domain-containing protein [Flavobacteriales bacterium]|nr:gliding motility-associated C-terminal domain-containing protein [Flavobacteriales bacterium]
MNQKSSSNLFKKLIPITLFLCYGTSVKSQVWNIGSEYFIQGSAVEVGINGSRGCEGADCVSSVSPVQPAGMHFRSNTQYFGFVANPQLDGWINYDGDFFTPGTPENGWGMEIGGTSGTKYHNNRKSENDIVGSVTSTTDINGCLSVIWEGSTTSGYDVHYIIEYQMNINDLYYTTKVKIVNQEATTIDDLYYYRNVDPDNNITIGGTYVTTNKVEAQPTTGGCSKAHVSAIQSSPWSSYLGFAGIHPNFRVGQGGFSNRDASDMHLGVGFTTTVGTSITSDAAMFLTYFIDSIAPGDTAEFRYVVILDASQAENAINSLYYFEYSGGIGAPPALCTYEVDTVPSCPGKFVNIELHGSNLDDFTWTWSPSDFLDTTAGTVVTANPDENITYTITGVPTDPCFTINVTQQIVVEMDNDTDIEYEIVTGNPHCTNNDGFAEVQNITGGIGPVTVQWTSGPSTPLYDNLFAGIYTVTLTDSFGCYVDTNVYLSNITTITATITIDSMAICGHNSGMFTVVADNGDPVYGYDIGLGNNPSGVFSGLADSTYVVGVSDEDGCLIFFPVTINDTNLLQISPTSIDELCEGVNGVIDMNVLNVNMPATFTLNSTSQPSDLFTGLASGTYDLYVVDNYGCTDTLLNYVIGDSSNFPGVITVDADPEDCETNNGQATVTVTGGVTPYSYNLNPGPVQTSNVFPGLDSNPYYVVVTDGNNCKDSLAFTIGDTASLSLTYVSQINDECDADIGQIVTQANAGTPPYTFTLTPAIATSTTGTFTGLPDGSYVVTVTTGSCVDTVHVTILELPSTLGGSIVNQTDENCGFHNGTFEVEATGGYSPYNYNIGSGSQTLPTFGGLNNGPYTVTITDSLGCTYDVPLVIGEIPINISLGPDVTYCNSYTILGDGVGNYAWTTVGGSSILGTNLSLEVTQSGQYVLTTYTSECADSDTIEVTLLPDPKIIIPNVFTPNGDGTNDEFEIQGMFVENYTIHVFNRWGQLLFTTTSLNDFWDGKDPGGTPVAEGVYMYTCTYDNPCEDPIQQTRHGVVQIFR